MQRLPTEGLSRSPPIEKASTLSRVLTGLNLSRHTSETAEEIRGPFGLNLLSAPAEPLVDFVFIHGLGGGSRKTWSKTSDPASFWPKEWLPQDPEFQHVRIHSFGYDADWSSRRESVLDIHDFAKGLLAALQGSPVIRRSAKLPIVMVGHSMGGIVMKKAYLLARHDPAFQDIGERLHTMYFLATPHHGAQSAQLLSSILSASHSGKRPFVRDIHQDSPMIQSINDEFRHYADKLQLYSFFETKATSFAGLKEAMVVTKTSAIMGYAGERTTHLDANHRGVCKFDSPSEANFETVKNAFLETVDKIKERWEVSKREQFRDHNRRLKGFLCVSDLLQESSVDLEDHRVVGSCDWLVRRSNFRLWRDSSPTRVFWLNGNPGTGKSFLSGYVVEHLRGLGHDCSWFFFKDGDKTRSMLSKCLLSLAYQMALCIPEIRHVFLTMQDDDIQFDRDDYKSIWRKLFLNGILQVSLCKPHYWVLDALDECKDCADLIPLVQKVNTHFPLHVFVTSRPNLELQSQLQQIGSAAETQHISPEDTADDIRLYVENHTDFPLMQEQETRQQLITTILAKSEGCFLWVRLVLKELRKVYSVQETRRILQDVPQGMDRLYTRTLRAMSTAPYGRSLARAILTWTICAVRPLTTIELKAALEIDIEDTVHNLEHQIASLCGHLVYVDPQSRIHMVHQTARGFLLSSNEKSDYAFNAKDGHRELALTCLSYLTSSEMKAPKTRRPSAVIHMTDLSPFAAYAANAFYEHVNYASSADNEILTRLYQFLNSPQGYVLSWIEYIAKAQDLNHMIQTGAVLRTYLKRRMRHYPALGKEIQIIEMWSTDMIRIVAKFGRNLLTFPPSIYHLIPPFCPRESAPYRLFGRSARGISVLGLSSTLWDDRLARLVYPSSYITAVACSNSLFAVGASDKYVRFYHTATCQMTGNLDHGEFIKRLEFSTSGRLLASAGTKLIKVWDVGSRASLTHIRTACQCIAMTFTTDSQSLILACNDNHLSFYNVITGSCFKKEPWFMDVDHSKRISRAPDTAAFSLEHSLLAFVYRGGHINLWNWENGEFIGNCEKPSAKNERLPFHASSLVFNPSTNASLLAAAYEAGGIIVFDLYEGDIKATYKADTDTQTLAASPDGKTLISGDSSGTLRIFDFETLKLIYIIHGDDNNIRALAFCSDNLRFVDIRSSECNVWEPAILARQNANESGSDTNSVEEQEFILPRVIKVDRITAIVGEDLGKYVFCGTENGLVTAFDSDARTEQTKLYSHSRGIPITKLVLNRERNVLASADSSSRVVVHNLTRSQGGWESGPMLLDHRMEEAVEQLLFNNDGTKLLVVTTTTDTVCALDGDETISVHWDTRYPGVWTTHPRNPSELILIVKRRMRIYDWKGLKELTSDTGIKLEADIAPDIDIRLAYPAREGQLLVTEYSQFVRSRSRLRLLLWDTAVIDPSSSSISTHSSAQSFGDILASLMGTFGTVICVRGDTVLFLNHDGWVCSVEMQATVPAQYKRHFFLPHDWMSTDHSLLFHVTAAGDMIFGRGHELAVIKRGLECLEIARFEQSEGQ